MKRRLFLTGEIGAGKSTAIAAAVGDRLPQFSGFLTKRNFDLEGRAASFSLMTTDGRKQAVFLDLTSGTPQIHMEVFEGLGRDSLSGDRLILDEIGGMEVLSPVFMDALDSALKREIPILGVLKGKQASDALAEKLGLSEEFCLQSERLWNRLSHDENTLIYTCEKYDEKALDLAMEWIREYCL